MRGSWLLVLVSVFVVIAVGAAAALAGKSSRELCEEQAHERCNRCHDDCARRFGDPKKGNRGGGWEHGRCKQGCDQTLLKEMAACK